MNKFVSKYGQILLPLITPYGEGEEVNYEAYTELISVLSIILGDILMSMVDPRISFSTKDR